MDARRRRANALENIRLADYGVWTSSLIPARYRTTAATARLANASNEAFAFSAAAAAARSANPRDEASAFPEGTRSAKPRDEASTPSGGARQIFRKSTMFVCFFLFFQVLGLLVTGPSGDDEPELRNFVYLTGQHPAMPVDMPDMAQLTHVALAFMSSTEFNGDSPESRTSWPLFTTIAATRPLVHPSTKLLVAIGGWGDTAGFEQGARTAASRRRFARNVAAMVAAVAADGVDIDWEYPGGNGEDYKQVPNSEKEWQIAAYPLLLAAIRQALGPGKVISAAVPGRTEDMMAFTTSTLPQIMQHVDFLNVMTYDLMNRRDSVTKHHTGVANSLAAVDAYLAGGCDAARINFGLAFYVKWFETEHDACLEQIEQGGSPLGCPTLQMEDPETGASLGREGAFSWHDAVPAELRESFARAQTEGTYDEDGGGFFYWDEQERLWWTFDTPDAIVGEKFPRVLGARNLGGVFAWGLGEDGPDFHHFKAMSQAWSEWKGRRGDREHGEL